MPASLAITGAEETVTHGVLWLKLAVELSSAALIGVGLLAALRTYVQTARARDDRDALSETRLTLARFLALALELQLGADILGTAVAPTWEQIGKLGAIAVIRTALNHFLLRELHEDKSAHPAQVGVTTRE